jgi:hypothetical protein
MTEGFPMMRFHFPSLSLALALLAFSFPPPSRAETLNCTPITSLPATISTQGLYCLTGNLATAQASGNAITINANNVTLDLNGWKVGGQAAGAGTLAIGIYSAGTNVTVKNGIVRGFWFGIYLVGRGATVEGITADQNTEEGIAVAGAGILVQGNQVMDTGGTTTATNGPAYAIYVAGPGSLIQNNLVSGLISTNSGSEYGIYFAAAATQSSARNNVVSDMARPSGGGSSYGIYMYDTPAVAVSNNIVTNFTAGVDYGGTGSATGTYSRNTAIGCDTPYSGGTAGSGND